MKTKVNKPPDGTVLAGKWRAEIDGAARGDYKVSALTLTRIGHGRKAPAVVVEVFGEVGAGSELAEIFEDGQPRNITLVGDTVSPEAKRPVIEINQAEPVGYSLGQFTGTEIRGGGMPSCEVVTFEAETWAFKAWGGS